MTMSDLETWQVWDRTPPTSVIITRSTNTNSAQVLSITGDDHEEIRMVGVWQIKDGPMPM